VTAIVDPSNDSADLRIENLVLDARSLSSAKDPNITASLIDARVDQSLTAGAPMLQLDVLDSDRYLLTSGILNDTVDVTLDKIPFRLVEADFDGADILSMMFEHRLVAYCRSHKRPRKFSRGSFTRAEAIFAMFREIKAMPFRFVAPDLTRRQPVAIDKEERQEEKDRNRAPGFPANVKLYGKSTTTPLSPGQVANAAKVLDTCRVRNAGEKATLAAVEACIIEAPDFTNNTGGDSSSVGILQLLDIHLNGSAAVNGGRRDIELVVTLFLTRGFTGKGGAITIARDNPTWTAGQVAQEVQGSAHPERYDMVRKQAQDIVAAYGGGDFEGGDYEPGTRKAYEFTRGQPGKTEDTWVAGQRLASQVRWRLFIAGKQTVYYASDATLMKSRPRYLIDPMTVGMVGHPRGPLELGGRTVLTRGRREPKPSKCELTVRMDRWAAGPGTVIEIADYGPYDGRWLVEGIDRPPFDSQATIQLRQPQKALKEPDTTRNRSNGAASEAAGDAVSKVYAEAGRISNLGLPYGPGGHGLSWAATLRLIGGGGAAGAVPGAGAAAGGSLDCSSSTSMALYAGGMMGGVTGPQVSDYFLSWGQGGEGKSMTVWVKRGSGANGHVWIEFKEPGVKRFDTSPYGDGGRGPRLRDKPRPTAGFTARHFPNT